MFERINIKAAAQLAVDAHQHVLVEGGGNALCVVVSSVENVGLFDQIKANQQRVARLQRAMHALQEHHGFFRLKISDSRANKEHQLASGQGIEVRDFVSVVSDDRTHAQAWEMPVQSLQSALQCR